MTFISGLGLSDPFGDNGMGAAHVKPRYPSYVSGGGGGGGGGSSSFYNPLSTDAAMIRAYDEYMNAKKEQENIRLIDTSAGRTRMIAMRMNWATQASIPFQYMETALVGDTVHLFLVVKDEAITIKDEKSMFPSDSLITNLRLLSA